MDWKLFKEQLPEKDRWIVYGNFRGIDAGVYRADDQMMQYRKKNWKDITHWDYCDPPPRVSEDMVWK